jgi:hypothetical protein
MTINELCTHFDKHEIVNTQLEIDRDYYAVMDAIYSDGEIKSHITREGYIHITSVHDASYIIFVDRDYEICLCVYKYIPDIMCKYIMENLHAVQCVMNKSNDDPVCDAETSVNIYDGVIDINTFTCTECNSEDKMIFTRSKTNTEALESRCPHCKTEYTFVPSKYYKLSSKRVIYFKSEESSRQIEIAEPKIETINSTSSVSSNLKQRNSIN